MKRVIRLTESDLHRIVKRVISEGMIDDAYGYFKSKFSSKYEGSGYDDDQKIADKILSKIMDNPENVKDLKFHIPFDDYKEGAYFTFKIGNSKNITSRRFQNNRIDLWIGGHKLMCDSETPKKIHKLLEKMNGSSSNSFLSSLDD